MEKKITTEVSQGQIGGEAKKKSSIGFIITIIILGLLLLISFALAGYFYYAYSKEKQKNSSLSSQVESLKKDKDSLVSQNDLLKKENDFYKANWNKSNQQTNANPYDKTIPQTTGTYIINDSNSRVISESELYNLTPWELKVARNEIYARHGRAFVSKDLACYFASQGWYKTNSNFSDSMLSNVENQNVSIILNYEKKTGSPLMNNDSGC